MSESAYLEGAGLGLRRAHLGPLLLDIPTPIQFLEIAPENWIGAGGRLEYALDDLAARMPLACHGLSLNLGGPDPIDTDFLAKLKTFCDRYDIRHYGDHLTFCADAGHLYELLPIPFTEEAARYVAQRIRQVQDALGRRITVENASYYCTPGQEIDEIDFILTVLHEADCLLLLDINNIYVNSVNHRYDPEKFLARIPAERIAYAHIAGHLGCAPDLIIDTHGTPVIDPVWDLLAKAYELLGVFPTLLERDENIPELDEVMLEVEVIAKIQHAHTAPAKEMTDVRVAS